MTATLVPLPLDAVCAPDFWRVSPSVRVRAKPERPRVSVDVEAERAKLWFQALEALPNAGKAELDYDQWFKVIAAIHHETGGSAEGLAVAQWWSARSKKHDASFLDERVWPYIRRGDERAGTAVTGGTIMSLASRLAGWTAPVGLEAGDGFVPVDGAGKPVAGATAVVYRPSFESGRLRVDEDDVTGVGEIVTPAGVRVERRVVADAEEIAEIAERQGIPPAHHLCTDQANANRLVREFGAHLMVAAGSWYVWDDRCWRREEAGVYRKACVLSSIVLDEARRLEKKIEAELEAEGLGADRAALTAADGGLTAAQRKVREMRLAVVGALEKWSAKSEMKSAIEAAIGLARKMLTVDAESLDRDVWALNVANGTVDLRTGELRAHRLEDRITKVADVVYRPEARSALWGRLLDDVCRGDQALVRFLRRWLGYCCSGSVKEQALAVHWGSGRNGKTTVMEAVADVLGDYAGVAAADLVASRTGASGAHSSSVVALMGKRLVLANESDEGAVLREGFVKMATGGERMDARYLYGEQFTFSPTHKLNLVTNHKPAIRGTDEGIWRRMRLVPWLARFGSEEEVREGVASAVRDKDFGARLRGKAEREGVLADLVSACREWYRGGDDDVAGRGSQSGLLEPDIVLAAVEAYRTEQDRIGQFLAECCEVGAGFSCPLTDPLGAGVYQEYGAWAKEAGIQPLSKKRFTEELERAVPGFRTRISDTGKSAGKRKKQTICSGLQVLSD